ncbi:MAG: Stp1/IreP family PP2C-type Ser/Thr phosphatase [Clostridia bacterium]|nr:Stp1/IreP family PP2C-type Ser/Thr phosphatase [Clostridia bacterium]
MQIYSKIDIGKVRHSNQDAYFAVTLDDESAFVIVCDGMGGANAGNVASATAIKIISDYVLRSYLPSMDDDAISNMLKGAVISANIDIYDMSLNNFDLAGMGTTVVTALIRKKKAIICHVGDSRAYKINVDIEQLTRDHSMVQSLLESGKLTQEQARTHPKKNIITRALGADDNLACDICESEVKKGDLFVFCTDGLSNYVDATEILKIFKSNVINDLPSVLIDAANGNGGGDNITVVIVAV